MLQRILSLTAFLALTGCSSDSLVSNSPQPSDDSERDAGSSLGNDVAQANPPPSESPSNGPPASEPSTNIGDDPASTGDAGTSSTPADAGVAEPAPTEPAPSTGEAVDCAQLTDTPTVTVLSGPRAARGIVFDDQGQLIGAGYEAIYRSTYDSFQVFVPGIEGFGQIDVLPSGDFVMADGRRIARIAPSGSEQTLTNEYGDYGLRTGPDGMLYAANPDGVGRIDPATAQRSLAVPLSGGRGDAARVIDFSPSLDRMYIGTEGARVLVVELDANLQPIGAPTEFIDLSDGQGCPRDDNSPGCWHDGIGVDVCGNVYIAAYGSSQLVRVSPDGSETVVLRDTSSNSEMFGHGVTWGSGMGGFRHDAVYLPVPERDDYPVVEVSIGVPYRTWTGTVLNGPTQ